VSAGAWNPFFAPSLTVYSKDSETRSRTEHNAGTNICL
jgi:hypothetical protein